jgi:hypothetical protein
MTRHTSRKRTSIRRNSRASAVAVARDARDSAEIVAKAARAAHQAAAAAHREGGSKYGSKQFRLTSAALKAAQHTYDLAMDASVKAVYVVSKLSKD